MMEKNGDFVNFWLRYKKLCLSIGLASLFAISNIASAGGVETPSNPWTIYEGLFGGYYTSNFSYQSAYFLLRDSTTVFTSRFNPYAFDTFQQGGLGGVQIGVQYHFATRPFFIGLATSAMGVGKSANLNIFGFDSPTPPNVADPTQDFKHHFQTRFVWDIAAVWGFDLTPYAHVYTKLGAAFQRLRHRLVNSWVQPAPAIPFSAYSNTFTRHYNYWGWLFGVGLTHDVNRWLSVFLEYDYYGFSNRRLATLDNMGPALLIIDPNNRDELAQRVWTGSYALKLGLNLKFMDTLATPAWSIPSSWMFYIGGFLGQANTDFKYQAAYFTARINGDQPSNHLTSVDAFQQGFSGGGQVGIQYHFKSPYFIGLNFSIAGDSQSAYYTEYNNTFTGIYMTNQFRVSYDLGIAFVAGLDLTNRTHPYTRLGANMARFKHNMSVATALAVFPPISREQILPPFRSRNIWGVVWGVGLTHDLNRWLSFFAEYDVASYSRRSLDSLTNVILLVAPLSANQQDRFTQSVRLVESTFRVGLNMKFNDPVANDRLIAVKPWDFYFGGFTGYYSADFQYRARLVVGTITPQPGMLISSDDAFQQGVLGGEQIGIQYHLAARPYFLGLEISGASNGRRANLSQFNIASSGRFIIPFANSSWLTEQFRVRGNVDITARLGFDVTPTWQFYLKAGGSVGYLKESILWGSRIVPLTVFFSAVEKHSFWGGTFGLGITHHWNHWLSTFAEYDYYSYSRPHLNNLNGIAQSFLPAGAGTNTLFQEMVIHSYALRVGFNLHVW